MKVVAEKTDSRIINVIDEFDFSTQNESYNDSFRNWRKKKDNKYSFSFEKNVRERVYVDGKGFVDNDSVKAEKEILSAVFPVIGKAMLIWVFTDSVLSKFIIWLIGLFGVNVHTSFFSTSVYGGSTEIVISIIAVALIKLGFTAFYLHNRFKMPKKVEFMSSMNHPSGLLGAIALSLVVCTVVNLPTAYSSDTKEIYEFFKSAGADVSVWGQAEFLVYTIFDVVVLSIVTEIIFRGAMFGVLRQFGDVFAIFISSLTASLLTQDLKEMIPVFFVSLAASWGMLKTGSLFTAFAVSMVYKMYELALAIIEVDPSPDMAITRNMFMVISFLVGVSGVLITWFRCSNRNQYGIALYKSEVTLKDRIITSVKIFPYSVVGIICIVYAFVRLLY